jgi:uncharacterized protein
VEGEGLNVVLVGGSGFLGRGLRQRLLETGHAVTVIGRGRSVENRGWSHVQWDAETLGDWVGALNGADVVVHLAGKRVDCRPTSSNIQRLIDSRVGTVRLVGAAIGRLDNPPPAWVQLSSLAIFGNTGDQIIDESTAVPTTGLQQQVEVCRRWEAAFEEATLTTTRSVLLRPGIAIGGDGDPASRQLATLARFGLGGSVGSGEQWVSWIGAQDFFDVLLKSVTDSAMSGFYHVTSPSPIRNRELMAAYRRAVGRGFGVGTRELITKAGAWMLGSDPALALTGRRCVPTRLLNNGYQFRMTEIDQAVQRAVIGGL